VFGLSIVSTDQGRTPQSHHLVTVHPRRRKTQVEDSLAQLRILSEESGILGRAIEAAQQSLEISTVQCKLASRP